MRSIAHLTVYVPGARPIQYDLKGSEGIFVLGRLEECEIRVTVQKASRKHAQIEIENGQYCLRDLGSTNGTLINGRKVAESAALKDGDKITIGAALLYFECSQIRERAAGPARKMVVDQLAFKEADLQRLVFHNDGIGRP